MSMENKEVALSQDVISSLVLNGDLSKMSPAQKVEYYSSLCQRIGLDPATQPFKILKLNGKEVMYADKGAAQQLSKVYGISHEILSRENMTDIYVVTVRAKLTDGRFTDEMGAVTIIGLKGDSLANAIMKAATKAKRRAVLALLGLGMLDESEVETIPNAVKVEVAEPKASPAKSEPLKQLPAPEPKKEEAKPDQPTGDQQFIIKGMVEGGKEKEGRFGIKIMGKRTIFVTFSEPAYRRAMSFTNKRVSLTYTVTTIDGKSQFNLLFVEPITESSETNQEVK